MIDSSKTPVLGSGGYAPGFRHTGVPTHRQSEKEPRCWGALSSGLAWLPTSGGHPPRTWVCPEGNLPHGRGPSLGEISPPPGGHPPPGETRLSRWSRGPTLKHPWAGVKFRDSPRPGDRGDLVLQARRGAPGGACGSLQLRYSPRNTATSGFTYPGWEKLAIGSGENFKGGHKAGTPAATGLWALRTFSIFQKEP